MDRISKSTLGTYLKCARKFYYSQLGFVFEPTDDMRYGLEMHSILEKYNLNLIKKGEVSNLKVSEEFKKPLDSYVKMLDEVQQQGYDKIPFAVELPVKYEHLFGYIDVIFRSKDGTKYLIGDYKTVMKFGEFDKEKYWQELAIYAYTYSKMNNVRLENISVCIFRFEQRSELHDINFVEINNYQMQKVIGDTTLMIQHLNKSNGDIKDFPMISPTKEAYECRWCEFNKDICR